MTDKYGINTDEFDEESYNLSKELVNEAELKQPVTKQDIDFVFECMAKEAPHDKQSIKQLFLGMLSAFTKLVIHHAISSKDAGAGKSYLLVLVAGYMPKQYVIALTGMSDKALLHKAGTMIVEDDDGQPVPLAPLLRDLEDRKEDVLDELSHVAESDKQKRRKLKKELADMEDKVKELKDKSEKLIVLENKIILLLDTTNDGMFNSLMSLISQDTDEQKYEFVDANGSKFETKANRLKGIPAIFTCQVVDDSRQVRYAEKNRRLIHVIPQTDTEKIKTAMDYVGFRGCLTDEEYDSQVVSREDKQKAERICSLIVKKLIAHSQHFQPKQSGIKVFFPLSISRSIMRNPNNVWGMTVMDRIVKYLAVITKMNMDSRPRLIDNEVEDGSRFYVISTYEDLKEALDLMGPGSSTLRPYIVYWYNNVFLPSFKELNNEPTVLKVNGVTITQEIHVGVTTKMLGDKTAQVMKVPKPNSDYLLKHYLYPLLNMGVIDKAQSLINKNFNIFFPVEESNINTLFSNEDDRRLEVYDPQYYPTSKMIEDSCRTVIEHHPKVGGVNSRKYRLVGHDGTVITPEELTQRYLNNPEVCFKESSKEQPHEQEPTEGDNTSDDTNISKNDTLPPLVWGDALQQFSKKNIEKSFIPHQQKHYLNIYNTGIKSGSQLILLANPADFFLSKIHPGILDNSIKIEFVTSKTSTNSTVRFLKRQTPEYHYYYSCYHCYDISKATFGSIDEYERHIVTGHKPATVGYPAFPDIEKLELERVRRKQQGFNTATLSGDALLLQHKGNGNQ